VPEVTGGQTPASKFTVAIVVGGVGLITTVVFGVVAPREVVTLITPLAAPVVGTEVHFSLTFGVRLLTTVQGIVDAVEPVTVENIGVVVETA
jgi:hypothetical protein